MVRDVRPIRDDDEDTAVDDLNLFRLPQIYRTQDPRRSALIRVENIVLDFEPPSNPFFRIFYLPVHPPTEFRRRRLGLEQRGRRLFFVGDNLLFLELSFFLEPRVDQVLQDAIRREAQGGRVPLSRCWIQIRRQTKLGFQHGTFIRSTRLRVQHHRVPHQVP